MIRKYSTCLFLKYNCLQSAVGYRMCDRILLRRWHAACVDYDGNLPLPHTHTDIGLLRAYDVTVWQVSAAICASTGNARLMHTARSRWHFSTIRQTSGGHDLWRSLRSTAQHIFRSDLESQCQRVSRFGAVQHWKFTDKLACWFQVVYTEVRSLIPYHLLRLLTFLYTCIKLNIFLDILIWLFRY